VVTSSPERGASAWLCAASGGTWAVVTPQIQCGEGASDSGTARRRQQTNRKRGGSAAIPAKLKLGELHKINTKPWLVFAAMMSNHRVDMVSAQLGDRIAMRAEPSARNGAGCRRVQAGQHQKAWAANRSLKVQRQAGRRRKTSRRFRASPRRPRPAQRLWRVRRSS
jgi:hypothetical protein